MEKKKCPYCDKVIEGYTKKQVSYLISQHVLSKHKELKKIKVNFSNKEMKMLEDAAKIKKMSLEEFLEWNMKEQGFKVFVERTK